MSLCLVFYIVIINNNDYYYYMNYHYIGEMNGEWLLLLLLTGAIFWPMYFHQFLLENVRDKKKKHTLTFSLFINYIVCVGVLLLSSW